MQSTLASVTAGEAAELLGVKPQTLYAYASRGLLRRVGSGKRRRYLREDLQRLQARQRARSGHGPVAASALSFGEPVLDTHITGIDERGPLYRGRPAGELATAGYGFEAVAELLWTGQLPETAPLWPPSRGPRRLVPVATLEDLLFALPSLSRAARGAGPHGPGAELASARSLIVSLAELVAGARARRPERRPAAGYAGSRARESRHAGHTAGAGAPGRSRAQRLQFRGPHRRVH